MSLKKLLVVPLIAATLLMTPIKKAEAGVIVYFGTASLFNGSTAGHIVGATLGTATVIGGFVFGYPIYYLLPPLGMWVMGGSLVLDANGNMAPELLAAELSEKYGFIDNQAVINDLVSTIKHRYETIGGNAYIVLSEIETRQILAPAALSESEIQEVVSDLQ